MSKLDNMKLEMRRGNKLTREKVECSEEGGKCMRIPGSRMDDSDEMNVTLSRICHPLCCGVVHRHASDWPNTWGAFSTNHSIESAFPAMSENSAAGSLDRIRVAGKDVRYRK
jgi:hypothetical protein